MPLEIYTNHCTAYVQLYSMLSVVLCLAVNCFSSCFIMAQGESRRQRTFLELRLQTVSLVSNLLAPITSNVQTYSCSESLRNRDKTDADSSSSKVGNDCIILLYFQPYIQLYLEQTVK